MQERASVANYLILPTRYAFPALVRIHAIVFSFVTKCRKGRKILSQLLMEGKLSFQLFNVTFDDETEPPRLYGEEPYPPSIAIQVNMGEGVQAMPMQNTFNKGLFRSNEMRDSFAKTQVERSALAAVHTDRFVNQALLCLYRKGTEEVKAFHKAKEIMKMGHELEGVILSWNRLIHGMEFQETAELELDLGAMGIRTSLAVLDRYSRAL